MTKAKITDEQIFALLDENKTNAEVARALGVKQTNINTRINKLRIQHKRNMKPKPLRFEDVRKDDRLMKDKKRLIVLSVDDKSVQLRGMNGNEFRLSRIQFEATAAEYTKVPPGDPQGAPVKTYIDPSQKISAGDVKINGQPIKTLPDSIKEKIVDKLKSDRKPGMTINPEFEAAVQEMEAQNKAREQKTTVEDLFKEESRVCTHFLKNCDHLELDGCDECTDYQEAVKIAEDSETVEPFNLDLEIEPITDVVDTSPRFEPVDYTDEDWFAIPARGTIERRIWDRAFNEIDEYHKAKQEVESALISGGRLPGLITDRYNKIVSKYSEEVGA